MGHVVNDRFFIHSVLDPSLSNIKHYKVVLSQLEDTLRTKGLTEYYTMADSVEGFKFNQFMGFETALEVWDDKYEVMRKAL